MFKFNYLKQLNEKQKIIIGVALAVLLIAIAFFSWLSIETAPADSSRTDAVKVDVRSGASIEETAALLNSQGLIKNSLAFSVAARLSGSKIEAGTHVLSASMPTSEILDILSSASRSNYSITVLPGQTLSEIREVLLANGFSAEEIESAFSKKYDHPLLASKPDNVDL